MDLCSVRLVGAAKVVEELYVRGKTKGAGKFSMEALHGRKSNTICTVEHHCYGTSREEGSPPAGAAVAAFRAPLLSCLTVRFFLVRPFCKIFWARRNIWFDCL